MDNVLRKTEREIAHEIDLEQQKLINDEQEYVKKYEYGYIENYTPSNYSSEKLAYIWLDQFDGIRKETKIKLIEKYNTYDAIKRDIIKDRDLLKCVINSETYEKMVNSIEKDEIYQIVENLDRRGIKVISKCDKDIFPDKLDCVEPVICLYAKGDINLLKYRYNIAIVGSRENSDYGKIVTQKFARELTQYGFVIVSGMARGVDTIAHRTCLQYGGKTIAVLCGGFNKIYPASNRGLFQKIIDTGGLVLTEQRPELESTRYLFPDRNRIISAISRGVVITEAGEKSGTTYTINYAIECGTELFAIPGPIYNPTSAGCFNLIREYPSTMTTSVEDITKALNVKEEKMIMKENSYQADLSEEMVLSIMREKKMDIHYDEIFARAKMTSKELNVVLTSLILHDLIEKLPGNLYRLLEDN